MKSVLAGLALSTCLLVTACGGQEPILVEPASIAADGPSLPAPVSPGPVVSGTAGKTAKPAASTSPTKRVSSSKPAASKASRDPEAACRAASKALDRLYVVRGQNSLLVVGNGATPEEVAASVAALLAATRVQIADLIVARGLTSDAEVRGALADLIASQKAVVTLLEAAGTDVDKKNATYFTVAEFEAANKLWQYPDGVCANYVD
jgi:hypothetical protein